MASNKLVLAAAGAGKTTYLVDKAVSKESGNVLITTFTEANESEIKKRLAQCELTPGKKVTVMTWFSFLLH